MNQNADYVVLVWNHNELEHKVVHWNTDKEDALVYYRKYRDIYGVDKVSFMVNKNVEAAEKASKSVDDFSKKLLAKMKMK